MIANPRDGATANSWMRSALNPASIAIIGASDNPEKIGGRPIKYMLEHGYRGKLYPVNPSRPIIQGLPSFASIDALPETPDMVIICVPGEDAVVAVEASAKRGVRIGVVISSGFGETGPEGRSTQDRMVAAARAGGMRLVGPNTQGLVNFSNAVIASFATLIGEVKPADGPVAIISQSGAMSVVPYAFLRADGIGVRHAYATGNECDLTVADFALVVADDPGVRLILLYMESVADPATLALAAARARQRNVPMVVLKAGVSARGQAAASSHTGALATEDKLLDAYFNQNGILRVSDLRSLVRAARLLLQNGTIAGRRVVAISNSGACCVMAADAADRHQLEMQPLPAPTRAALNAVLPAFASSTNPIDLTAALLSNSRLFGDVLPIVAKDDVADALFISLPMSGKGYDVPQFASDTANFVANTGKPTVVASPLASTRRVFEDAGVVTFEHDEDAMAALGQLARVSALRREAGRLSALPVVQANKAASLDKGRRFLSEHESLMQITALEIPAVPYRLCRTHRELQDATRELSGPWVLKACSAEIPHKTEYGLVKLSVQSETEAQTVFDAIVDKASSLGKPLEGVIVASMLPVRREMIIGARWEDDFSAVVIIGGGGKYVEAMPDVVTLLYPFDAEHAVMRMSELRMAPLFGGVRGEGPLPLRSIAEVAVRLGHWLHSQGGRVVSADINPLLLGQDGAFAAADALVELAGT